MEELKKKNNVAMMDKEILFSKAIKAGKRIYYLDVKKNRKEEMFLTITESKKVVNGEGDNIQVNFEKHKIFLYREDFEKFMNGLNQTIEFINVNNGEADATAHTILSKEENSEEDLTASLSDIPEIKELNEEIKIDIDF